MNDGAARVETRFSQLLMARSPAQRLAMSSHMFATAKSLVRAGILKEHGSLNPDKLREHLFLRLYEQDFKDVELAKILNSWKTT